MAKNTSKKKMLWLSTQEKKNLKFASVYELFTLSHNFSGQQFLTK